jgi:hypothetical protein
MRILASPLPAPKGGRHASFVQEVDFLSQDVAWEALEDLSPREAAAQITLWVARWRKLEAGLESELPRNLYRSFRRVLELIVETTRRYPGTLPAIPALERDAQADLQAEVDRARDLLAEEELRRSEGGWKEDLLAIAETLGIGPAQAPAGKGEGQAA